MRPVDRRARFGIVGLTTLALAALGAFGGWAALSTDASTASAARDSQLSEAYGQARYAVAKLELAVGEYRQKPIRANQRHVTEEVRDVRAALPAITRNGGRRDRSLVIELRRQIDATGIGLAA